MSKWSFIKSRYWRIGALLFGVAVVGGTFVWLEGRGPWYHGHSLQYWMDQLVWYRPKKMQREAREALRAMGEPAVARLAEIAGSDDPPWRKKLWNWHQQQQLSRMRAGKTPVLPYSFMLWRISSPPGMAQAAAVRALGELGPAASNALPVLENASVGSMSGYKYMVKAAQIKIRIGTAAGQRDLASLLQDVEDANSPGFMAAAYALADLGTNARPAIPALCRALNSSIPPNQYAVAHAICSLRIEAKQCVPALIQSVERHGQMIDVLTALGLFGEAARPAIPVLRKQMLTDTDPGRRQFTASNLKRIMGEKEFSELVKLQEQAANGGDLAVRERAVKALDEIDRKAASAPMVDEPE